MCPLPVLHSIFQYFDFSFSFSPIFGRNIFYVAYFTVAASF
jgi:hypothetical protein